MSTWSFYRTDTGLFVGRVKTLPDDSLLEINTPLGCSAMLGVWDHVSQRVDVALMEASRGDLSEPSAFVVDHQPPAPPDHDVWRAEFPDAPDRVGQRWRWAKGTTSLQRERKRKRARAALDVERGELLDAVADALLAVLPEGEQKSRLQAAVLRIAAAREDSK